MEVAPYTMNGCVVIVDKDLHGLPDRAMWAYHAVIYTQIRGLLAWGRIWVDTSELLNEISWLEVLIQTGTSRATAIEMVSKWNDDKYWEDNLYLTSKGALK